MTPYQLRLMAEYHNERIQQETEDKISLAYMQALWTIQWLGKKKPESLNKILGKKEVRKEMTPEEMLNQIKEMNAKLGGSES